jgi:hypothetical protein
LGWVGLEPTTNALKGRWRKLAKPLRILDLQESVFESDNNCTTAFRGSRQAQATKFAIDIVAIPIEKEPDDVQ